MNKYQLTTEKKKRSIIQAALSLFKRMGFKNVSISEIAKSAKVSKASIYNYFGSKEAVMSECVDVVMHGMNDKANEILSAQDISFLEKIEAALALCEDEINKALSEYFSQNALRDESLCYLLLENVNRSKNVIYRSYVEHGKAQGALDNSISTEIYVSFLEAVNTMGTKLDFSDDANGTLEQIHKLVLYGLVGR